MEPKDPPPVVYRASMTRGARVPKASSVLADEFRAKIVTGEWNYGESIGSESELVERSGFSRGTVREALRLLEADGLLTVKRGARGGISLARPDLSQVTRSLAFLLTLDEIPLRSLFQFRKLVEPAAARLAAENITPEQSDRLNALTDGDRPGYQDEADFHELIAHCTGNQLLSMMLVVPHELLHLHLQGQAFAIADVQGARRAHRLIAQAISVGAGADAERLMLNHLERFEELMVREGRMDDPIIGRSQWETFLHRGR